MAKRSEHEMLIGLSLWSFFVLVAIFVLKFNWDSSLAAWCFGVALILNQGMKSMRFYWNLSHGVWKEE